MQTPATVESMFAGFFGGWEVAMILAGVLVLFGAGKIPEILRGLKAGGSHFWQSLRQLFDSEAHSAGQSVGGIYGKRAAQALTPDNQVAELYDPPVFQERRRRKNWPIPGWLQFWQQVWRTIHRLVARYRRTRK